MNTPTTPPTPDTPDTSRGTEDTTYLPQAPETRVDDSLADEVFVDDARTTALPTTAAPATTAATTGAPTGTMTATAPATAPRPAPPTPPEPTYLSGPAPFALVLGLLGLLVAGSVLVNELTDISLPWGDLGPWSVVAAGLVVLLVGAIGLRSSRNRG
ncbi:MAG TPA: hypothetical protein VFL10_04190 [Ornithinibacter sp.]|nr:hypothetical protein [Ornithinibacter sp.]